MRDECNLHLDWWQALPQRPGPGQDYAIVEAHKGGIVDHCWAVVTIGPLSLVVSERAAAVGGRRLRYTAATQQRVADWLDALLLTPAIVDAIWAEATVRLAPCPLGDGRGGPAPDMALVSAWGRHDIIVDHELRDRPGLVASEGKDWVLHSKLWQMPTRAVNYGWLTKDGHAVQPPGAAHDAGHSDYSQAGRWVARQCGLRGDAVDLGDVLTGKHGDDVARLAGGPLPADRAPWAGERRAPGGSAPPKRAIGPSYA